VFLEFGALHAGRTARGGNECSALDGDQDRALLALGNAEPLAVKFGTKRRAPFGKGFSQRGAVETRRNPLRPFTCGVGKAFCPVTSSFGARWLDGLAVVQFVAAGEVFKTSIVILAVEHPQRPGIDLGNGKVKMAPAIFDVADDEARSIGTDMEFRIHRSEEFG